MRKTLFVAAVLGLAASSVYADQGSTAAAFLQLDTSPRVIGMGDSFAGLADDVSAIEYNPAGAAYLTQKEVTLLDAIWIADINYDYGAIAWPCSFGTLSADFFYLSAGTFQGETLVAGQPVAAPNFTAADMYGTLAYSRKILPSLSAGLSVKFLSETIAEYSTGSVAVGLSGFYRTPIPGMNLGLSINNLGPSEGFQQGYALPANFRFGVGYQPMDGISVDTDYLQYFNTVGTWSVGGEYAYKFMVVRMGYKYGGAVDYNQVEDGSGPAAAAGLNLGLGFRFLKNYSADYSYSPEGFFGASQVFSLTAKFD